MAKVQFSIDCQMRRSGRDMHFEYDGELSGIMAVFGPNGAGKTSFLRLISGLETNVKGTLRVDGKNWSHSNGSRGRGDNYHIPAHKRPVGMVFQNCLLFSHLNVVGNLNYALRRAKGAGKIALDDVVEVFELKPLLPRRAGHLSGGERQRVAIARALLSGPRLLLMDEPLAALDIQRRAKVLSYIEQIPDVFNVPVIYVTHSIDEVARLANQTLLMKNGAIVAVGPTPDILSRLDLPPLTGRFEAGVILAGQVTGGDDVYDLTRLALGGGQELMVPRLDLPMGSDVRLRIRARDVALATVKPRGISIRNVLLSTVREIMPEAETAYAEVLLDLNGQALRSRITRAAVDELNLKPGGKAYALVKSVALDRRLLTPPRIGTR